MERFGGVSMTEYLQQSNDALVIIVQIETKQALENVWASSFSRKASLAECQRRSTQLPKFLALIACSLDPLTLATTLVTQSSTMLCKVRIFRADTLLSPSLRECRVFGPLGEGLETSRSTHRSISLTPKRLSRRAEGSYIDHPKGCQGQPEE